VPVSECWMGVWRSQDRRRGVSWDLPGSQIWTREPLTSNNDTQLSSKQWAATGIPIPGTAGVPRSPKFFLPIEFLCLPAVAWLPPAAPQHQWSSSGNERGSASLQLIPPQSCQQPSPRLSTEVSRNRSDQLPPPGQAQLSASVTLSSPMHSEKLGG
jgi:hypothetical protein